MVEHTEPQPYIVIEFIFISLGVGALIQQVLKGTILPYTVYLLLYGMLVGGISFLYSDSLGFAKSASVMSNVDPHLMLYLFLPPLIFESAYSIDYIIFQKTVLKSLILAVPALLISVGLIAGMFKYILYPDWSWVEAALMGAVLSATDPVAVVALLKTLGASKILSSLIESESLLNDGTAVVVFSVLKEAVTHELPAIPRILWTFSYMSLGGILWGAFCSYIALYWLGTVFNKPSVEITITLSTAYLVFYYAESDLHISGVLAVVAFGLAFSQHGPTSISPEVQHFLHEFWYIMEYLANTLIFVLTGLIIVMKNAKPDAEDWTNLIINYVGLTIIRTTVIFLCLPIFRRMKYGFTWQEALVCSWGGLRGAVGLAMALALHLDENILTRTREKMLFQTAGIVMCTLLINGSTMGVLVRYLGMLKVSPFKVHMRKKAWSKVQERMEEDIKNLKASPFYSNANWDLVRDYTTLDSMEGLDEEQIRKRRKRRLGSAILMRWNTDVVPQAMLDAANEGGGLWLEMRTRVLMTLRTCFSEQYEMGIVGAKALNTLQKATSTSLEQESDEKILDWNQFRKYMGVEAAHTGKSHWDDIPIYRQYKLKSLYEKLAFGIDLANGYRYAHESALKLLNDSHLATEFRELERVQLLLRHEMEAAQSNLYDMYNIFPKIYVSVSSRHSARILLHQERSTVNSLKRKGLIGSDEAADWTSRIEAQMKKLLNSPTMVGLPSSSQILKAIPWIKSLSETTFKALSYAATPVIFSKGHYLVKDGDEGGHVYLISRGNVSINFNYKQKRVQINDVGVGSTIGEISLLRGTRRSCHVQAQGTVLVFRIAFKDMYALMKSDPQLERNIWEHASHHMAENLLHLVPEYDHITETRVKLKRYVKRWEFFTVLGTTTVDVTQPNTRGQIFPLARPIMLLHGAAIQLNIKNQCVVLPKNKPRIFDPIKHASPTLSASGKTTSVLPGIHDHGSERRRSTVNVHSRVERNSLPSLYREAPVHFEIMNEQALFVYAGSRVMVGPDPADVHVDPQECKEMQDKVAILMTIPWIEKCGEDVATFLISVAETKVFHVGHSFIMNKAPADSFFVVLDGFVSISAEIDFRQVIVDTKGKGSCIGELAFLTGAIRNATVTARTKVTSLCIMYPDLRLASEKFPEIEQNLWFESASTVAIGVLRSSPKFKHLNALTTTAWISTFDLVVPDESLQGENTYNLPEMFIIVYGSASIVTNGGSEKILAPYVVSTPSFRPEASLIEFRTGTRLMIPKRNANGLLSNLLKRQQIERKEKNLRQSQSIPVQRNSRNSARHSGGDLSGTGTLGHLIHATQARVAQAEAHQDPSLKGGFFRWFRK